MGCADSKQNKRNVYHSSFFPTSKNSTNNSKSYLKYYSNEKFPQNSFGQKSRLAPFYEQLQDLYRECDKDFRKFIMMIEQRVSEIYMEISQQTLANMNHEEIAAQQSKIIISEEILSLNLNVLKVIGQNINFEYDKETFKELNKFQHHLVGYLKTKYPRGQQTFVSGDLMKIFKEFDRVNDLNYDILKNSNTYFGQPEEEKIIKGIKIFVNKIIKQCDKFYPDFQKLMQDRAFFIKNEKGQKTSLNYKIGRKIAENVSKYQDLDTGVLQVFSPQVFRVLIKWMEDLEETIKNSAEKISKKQSFKCYVGEKPISYNQLNPGDVKKQKQLLFDYINKYEYDKIVDKLISKINALKPKLQGKNNEFVNQLDEFNQRLLKILNQADPKQRYVPTRQIETIKYSSFNAKFVEYILTQKLVYVIKELIKLGQSFIGETSLNLDVIKFRVTDLMRCQVSGNKKEILQIYNNFRKLQEQGNIEIIKIKNRLSTPLNDAMIIFVMKGSWIICQAQLVLSQSGAKIDKRSKNTELVNHYFYELERSPYGIMAEIAVLLTYKDSKVIYENKITFHESNIDMENCKLKHKEKLAQSQQQKSPFICSKCSVFYAKSQNLFKLQECKQCKIAICSKCILKKNPQLENSFITRDINRKLQQKINELEKSGKQKREAMGSNGGQNINKKITPKQILSLFYIEKIKLRERFDDKFKTSGTRKIQASKLMENLSCYYDSTQTNKEVKYFLVVNFFRGEAGFKLYSYDQQYKEIENTSDPRQKYDESSYFSFSEYDSLFLFPIHQVFHKQPTVNQNHLFLFLTKNQLQAKIDQVKRLKAQGKINKDQQYEIISIQIRYSSTRLVLDYAAKRDNKRDNAVEQEEYDNQAAEKKEFKYPSLKVLGDMLPALKSARTSIQFDDLGIETKHLDYFRDLSWRHSIKELMLANNKIENVTIILDNLSSLQRFYFNENYVKQLRFNKPIPNLQILNGSKNLIASIQGLNNIGQIRKLLLESNKLKQFPISKDLKDLNVLNLRENYLSNVSNILNTNLPQLQQLIISGQLVEYNSNQDKNDVQSQKSDQNNGGGYFIKFWRKGTKEQQMVIQYPKLKNFQSQNNYNLLKGRQISFTSDSLEKISLNNCSIDRVIFDRRQCIENLKYLHLSGNKIKYFSFLGANQPRVHRRLKDSSVNSDSQIDNKSISNDSLVVLILSENQIQYLPVMKFSSLKRLQLQCNQIKDIRAFQKSKLSQLQYLDLGDNLFTQISNLNLPKLTTLKLQQMREIYKVDTIFKGPCQLPSLENISFSLTQKIDFSFDLNPKNNLLTKLKQINFENVKLLPSKKQATQFQVSTLEKLSLKGSQFDHFPILKLPKITTLSVESVKATSFKSLERSKLPSLTNFTMAYVQQNIASQQVVLNPAQNNGLKQQDKAMYLNKYLTCDFNFPKLKNLNISNMKLGSLKSLSNHSFDDLETLTLKKIEIMDNKLPKIRAPNIKSIEIVHLQISNVDSFLNNGFSKLKNLSLESNGIESISESALGSLSEIKILSFAGNKLKKFVCNKNLDKLIFLDLSNNKLSSFPRIKAKILSEIRWQGNKFNDLSELQYCQLPSLESMQFQSCDLSKSAFPKMNLNSLETLKISDSKLSDLTNLTKSNLPALRQLNLMNNQIANFPVINMPRISDLYLHNNKIKDLQFLQKSNLQNLTVLTLSFNPFTKIPSELQFSHLKIFQCSNVNLGNLPLMDLPDVQEITIQYAQLTDITQFAKGQYKQLKSLNLSNNKITYLPRVEMESLNVVVIDNNLIEDLSDFLDSDFTVTLMEWFSFENNKIRKVPNLLFGNVTVIYLNDNPLQEFNCLSMLEYPQLTGIYLNNTNVKKFRIPRLPKLLQIEMSGSKVEDLNWLVSVAPNVPQLAKVAMNDCKITQVPNLDQIKSLQYLYLGENPIRNIDGFINSQLICSISELIIQLDVGDFEKKMNKITEKNQNAVVSRYYAKNKNNE